MSDFFITYGGKRYDSGLTYGDSSQGEIRFDLGENKIVQTLRYLSQDGSLRVYRAVASGNFSFNNGAPSGEVKSASLFSVTIESGVATEFAQSYNFTPALTVSDWLAGYPTVDLPEGASSANYFYTNSADLSVGRGAFTETPIFSSRDSLAGLIDMNYFPNYWWENPFSDSLSIGGNTSTNYSSIPEDVSIFSVTPSSLQVNEGDSVKTSLAGFTPGSTLYFKVSGRGINKKDFAAGALKGKVTVNANGVASIAHTLKIDKATEGAESFSIQVFSDKKTRNRLGESAAVEIGDTSVKAAKPSDGKDSITGSNIGPDQGTWSHSNYGYNVLTSPTTQRQFLAGGNNQPIFWDANKNTYHADSVDKTIGLITYAQPLNWPQSDQESLNGTWVIPAGSTTGYMYFGNGELGAYINLSTQTI